MVHAIIFDMDGVLIDSQPMHYLGDQQTLAAHGVDVPVEAMTAYAGTTNQLRFELFKERYHLSETIDSLIGDHDPPCPGKRCRTYCWLSGIAEEHQGRRFKDSSGILFLLSVYSCSFGKAWHCRLF